MKTILVPTDFSSPARRALEYALSLARHTHSRIILFHAFHRPINVWQASEVFETIRQFEETEKIRLESLAREVLEAELTLAGPPLREAEGKGVSSKPSELELSSVPFEGEIEVDCVARFGLVEDEIIRMARESEANLVIMGMRGANALSELLLGSTTTGVMRKTPCPVLAVPELAAFQPIRKILFATDFRGLPEANMMKTLLEFRKAFGASLCLVHIYDKHDDEDLDRNAAADELEYYLRDQEYTLYFVEREDVLEGIMEHLEKLDPQLLAVVPRQHSLIDRILGYSLSKKLAFTSPIPLLALPGDN
jgi:nucleotide-binding universal stress UspA family protein